MSEIIDQDKIALLRQVLTPASVRVLDTETKDAALRAMIETLSASPLVRDPAELTQAVFKRETLMSTGIGLGLAVPHVRIESVSELIMAVGISKAGIADYGSLDDKPVHLIFLIAAPKGQHDAYLRLLSVLSTRARALNGRLLECADKESFLQVFLGADGTAGTGQ